MKSAPRWGRGKRFPPFLPAQRSLFIHNAAPPPPFPLAAPEGLRLFVVSPCQPAASLLRGSYPLALA